MFHTSSSASHPPVPAGIGTHGRNNIVLALAAGLAGLMFGLDTGVIAGALGFIRNDLQADDRMAEWIVSSLMLGAAAGSAIASPVADRWGRKGSLLIAGALFLGGIACCSLSPDVPTMIAGRVLLGLGVGLAAFAAPLYIAEIADRDKRGRMISTYQLMITLGILLAFTSDSLLTRGGHWRLMFAILAIPTVLFVIATAMLPYSPRWLVTKGRNEEARAVLRKLRASADEADEELSAIVTQLGKENSSGAALLAVSPGFRRTFALGVTLQVLQQFTGINVLMYYAPTVIGRMGFSPEASVWCTTGLGVANMLATIGAIALIDSWGRRALLTLSTAFAAASMAGFGTVLRIGATSPVTSALALGFLTLFIVSFAAGAGPLPWIICSEIQPLRGRTFAISCSTLANWAANWLVSNIFLSSMAVIGDFSVFWCLAACNVLLLVVGWLFVPETRGCSLEALEVRITAGVPLRRAGTAE